MVVIIEIDTEKHDVQVTDKKTGNIWTLEPEPEMDGTVITPDMNTDREHRKGRGKDD